MIDTGLFNQQAEEAVVGSLFLKEELVKECTVLPEQLYLEPLQNLLSVIKRLDEKGKPIDVISVLEEVGEENIQSVGGISYITELVGRVPTTENFHLYQSIVKEYHQKRNIIGIADKIISNAHEGDFTKTVNEGIHHLMEIEEDQTNDELGEIKTTLVEFYQDCEKDLGEIQGIPSGFIELDRLTGGFQESDFIVVGARPSVGKTAFALNIALNSSEHDIGIVFSLEMSKKQLLKRAASCIGNINSTKMRNPRKCFEEDDWSHLSYALGKVSQSNLHIFDKAGMDIHYIWSKLRKIRSVHGEKKRMLVVIDYLQLIIGDPKHKQNRQAEISEISRTLKTMARELNLVVIALSQLSRGVESRQDKRPLLSDLRESGQIEQDADVIAFLYRDDYYDKNSNQKNIIEVIMAKQRNGPIGTIQLAFMKEYGKFLNLNQ